MHNQLYILTLGPAAPSSSGMSLPEGLHSEKRKRREQGCLFLEFLNFKI